MTMQNKDQTINAHYGKQDLGAAILAALQADGKDPDHLQPDDLAPIEHLHTRGKEATLHLLQLAPLQTGTKVLDVGGGLGGTARFLARSQGCSVTVLDLTEEFCRVGEMLTQRSGLSDLVRFQQGSALDMPFPDASFEAVWTQHSSMNIEDKPRLYREFHRVLQPGGQFAFFEIMAGPVQAPRYPVPWASEPSISFLVPPENIRHLLADTGFKEIKWQDASAAGIDWFRARAATSQGKPRSNLGQHLLFGAIFDEMFHNIQTNLEERRIVTIEGVFERI